MSNNLPPFLSNDDFLSNAIKKPTQVDVGTLTFTQSDSVELQSFGSVTGSVGSWQPFSRLIPPLWCPGYNTGTNFTFGDLGRGLVVYYPLWERTNGLASPFGGFRSNFQSFQPLPFLMAGSDYSYSEFGPGLHCYYTNIQPFVLAGYEANDPRLTFDEFTLSFWFKPIDDKTGTCGFPDTIHADICGTTFDLTRSAENWYYTSGCDGSQISLKITCGAGDGTFNIYYNCYQSGLDEANPGRCVLVSSFQALSQSSYNGGTFTLDLVSGVDNSPCFGTPCDGTSFDITLSWDNSCRCPDNRYFTSSYPIGSFPFTTVGGSGVGVLFEGMNGYNSGCNWANGISSDPANYGDGTYYATLNVNTGVMTIHVDDYTFGSGDATFEGTIVCAGQMVMTKTSSTGTVNWNDSFTIDVSSYSPDWYGFPIYVGDSTVPFVADNELFINVENNYPRFTPSIKIDGGTEVTQNMPGGFGQWINVVWTKKPTLQSDYGGLGTLTNHGNTFWNSTLAVGGAGDWTDTSTSVEIGWDTLDNVSFHQVNGFLRYAVVADQGQTIYTAVITLHITDDIHLYGAHNQVHGVIAAYTDDDAAWITGCTGCTSPTSAYNDTVSKLPYPTTASTSFSMDDSSVGTYVQIDVKDIVQEIVNRPGWVSGNHIMFMLMNYDSMGQGAWAGYTAFNRIQFSQTPTLIYSLNQTAYSDCNVYVQGRLRFNGVTNPGSFCFQQLRIGCTNDTLAYPFFGDVSGLMLWSRALSSGEIANLFDDPFSLITYPELWNDYNVFDVVNLQGIEDTQFGAMNVYSGSTATADGTSTALGGSGYTGTADGTSTALGVPGPPTGVAIGIATAIAYPDSIAISAGIADGTSTAYAISDVNSVETGGDGDTGYGINIDLDILWQTGGILIVEKSFYWNVGEQQLTWFRVQGCCKSPNPNNGGGCDVIGIETDDPLCGNQQFIQNIVASGLSDLCQILQDSGLHWQVCSIKRFSRPADGRLVTAEDVDCNTLTEVDFCDIPECIDFCLKSDAVIKMNMDVTVSMVSVYFGDGTVLTDGEATTSTDSSHGLSLFSYEPDGGNVIISGESDTGYSWDNDLLVECVMDISIEGEEAIFNTDPEAPTLSDLTFTVSTDCGSCNAMPLVLNVGHNLSGAGVFSQFLKRNGLTMPESIPMHYSKRLQSWLGNCHFTGIGNDNANTQESWRFTFDWSCVSQINGVNTGLNYWKFSILAVRNNGVTDFDTRVVLIFPPDQICDEDQNFAFDFSFNVNTLTHFVNTDLNFSLSDVLIADNIGLFKSQTWTKNPYLRIKLSRDAVTPLSQYQDIYPIFPQSIFGTQ